MAPNHTAYSKLYPGILNKRRGQESNLCLPGSEPGATTNSCRLGVKRFSALRPGIAPDLRASKARVASTRRRESFLQQSKLRRMDSNHHSSPEPGAALPIGPHRIVFKRVRTTGFEPAISCTRSTRNTKLSHTLITRAPSEN